MGISNLVEFARILYNRCTVPSASSFLTPPSRVERITALLLLLVGFGLRLFRLDLQSIWSDEGLSIYRASQDLSAIPGLSVAGIHPPLYDTLLHFWTLLAGNREFSTRYLSLFFGVLSLVVLFQIGRSLLGRGGAILATLVAVAAPFLVYYSQETRMYAPALFFSLLSVLAALRWMQGGRSRVWLACYAAATVAAAYSHYYAWLIVAFLNLFVLLWALASGRRGLFRLAPWVGAQAGLGLAYVPWAGVLLNKYETYLTPGSYTDPLTVLYQTFVSFGLSYSAGQAAATPGQIDVAPDHQVVLALALAIGAIAAWGVISGVFPANRRKGTLQWAFLPLYLAVPILAIMALSWGRRDFAPRYLIFAAPAYYLLIGQGLASLLRSGRAARIALGVAALLLVLGASSLSLHRYYYNPTYWRDDIRGVADFINGHSRKGDAVILNAYYLGPSFFYYYRQDVPVVGLPGSIPPNWDKDLAILADTAGSHDRLWLVLWQTYFTDPEGRIQDWVAQRGFPFQEVHFRAGFTIVGYLTHAPVTDAAPPGQPVGLEMGHTVKLESYQLPSRPICAGEEMPFTIYWRALRPISADYNVFVHLLDDSGKLMVQADSPPAGIRFGGFPTSNWPVGPTVIDERQLQVPFEVPPGQYHLEVGMYDLKTMKRLGEGDPEPFQTRLGPLQILPPGCKSQP